VARIRYSAYRNLTASAQESRDYQFLGEGMDALVGSSEGKVDSGITAQQRGSGINSKEGGPPLERMPPCKLR